MSMFLNDLNLKRNILKLSKKQNSGNPEFLFCQILFARLFARLFDIDLDWTSALNKTFNNFFRHGLHRAELFRLYGGLDCERRIKQL